MTRHDFIHLPKRENFPNKIDYNLLYSQYLTLKLEGISKIMKIILLIKISIDFRRHILSVKNNVIY